MRKGRKEVPPEQCSRVFQELAGNPLRLSALTFPRIAVLRPIVARVRKVESRRGTVRHRKQGVRYSKAHTHPKALLEYEDGEGLWREGESQLTAGKVGLGFAEERRDGRGSTCGRVLQRDADSLGLDAVMESDD